MLTAYSKRASRIVVDDYFFFVQPLCLCVKKFVKESYHRDTENTEQSFSGFGVMDNEFNYSNPFL